MFIFPDREDTGIYLKPLTFSHGDLPLQMENLKVLKIKGWVVVGCCCNLSTSVANFELEIS